MRQQRILLLVVLLCLASASAIAQKTATVKSFTQTTDHIPGNDRRKDLNGVPCALVKVQIVDDIERVEGNKIGDIVKHGVEKWIYMCKGSRNMRIHLKNHLPVKIMFQDYHIGGLESNRVYELVIEIPDMPAMGQVESPTIVEQKLIINYSPANAMVLVDSKPYKGKGKVELQLAVGDHSYLIAADGYITAEGVVRLNERAPREITEHLVVDHSSAPTEERQPKNPSQRKTKKSKKPIEAKKSGYGQVSSAISQPAPPVTPPKALNKSFKYYYEGVVFKCKAKKGYVTITGFDVGASDVRIPAQVEYAGSFYPVKYIDTFINGNNYSAARLVIEEGIQGIANFAFMEFRKLVDVTIPNSIREIGKNAFRDNPGMMFNLPSKVDENDLRAGHVIKTSN